MNGKFGKPCPYLPREQNKSEVCKKKCSVCEIYIKHVENIKGYEKEKSALRPW